MIKANDLRVGNYIKFNNHLEKEKIVQVNLRFFASWAGGRNTDEMKVDEEISNYYTGIELNPVNLLKCGFVLGDGYYWKTWGTNGMFIVKFDTVYNKFFVEAGKGFNLLVEYVHELQNAFHVFSLGRELEVVW